MSCSAIANCMRHQLTTTRHYERPPGCMILGSSAGSSSKYHLTEGYEVVMTQVSVCDERAASTRGSHGCYKLHIHHGAEAVVPPIPAAHVHVLPQQLNGRLHHMHHTQTWLDSTHMQHLGRLSLLGGSGLCSSNMTRSVMMHEGKWLQLEDQSRYRHGEILALKRGLDRV